MKTIGYDKRIISKSPIRGILTKFPIFNILFF